MKKILFTARATLLVIFFSNLPCAHLYSQVQFQRLIDYFPSSGNDWRARSVIQTTDGGYVLSGDNITGQQLIVCKTDANGLVQWSKAVATGNAGGEGNGHSVNPTNDGGFIVAGSVNNVLGVYSTLILKLDAGGNIEWNKVYGNSNNVTVHTVRQVADGGYIASGHLIDTNGSQDILLMKTDANGNLQWARTVGTVAIDESNDVLQTADGGYILCGQTQMVFAPPFGSNAVYVAKFSGTGILAWVYAYYDSAGGTFTATSLFESKPGRIMLTGFTDTYSGFIGYNDIFLFEIDGGTGGGTIWSKVYDRNEDDRAHSLIRVSGNRYALSGFTGTFGNDQTLILLMNADSLGNFQWAMNYGTILGTQGYNVKQTTDGGFIIGGRSQGLHIGYSSFLIKTDNNGNSGCNEDTLVFSEHNYTLSHSSGNDTALNVSLSDTSLTLTENTQYLDSTLCSTPVGIFNGIIPDDRLTFFPNPAADYITIQSAFSTTDMMIEITDISGKVILHRQLKTTSERLQVSELSPGIYFLRLCDEFGYHHVNKLMVE